MACFVAPLDRGCPSKPRRVNGKDSGFVPFPLRYAGSPVPDRIARMSSANNLVELRQLLAERFPQVRIGLPALASPVQAIATGVPGLDSILGGGFPRGELTELVGAGRGSGSCLVLHSLLRRAAMEGQPVALVDGADSFDVTSVIPEVLAHLLWVRCARTDDALKAADLLLRDPNFSLVVIDLKLNSPEQLRKINASVWHRFARLLEQNKTTVLVITPRPLISGVNCRVQCENRLGIDTLTHVPSQVLPTLRFSLPRSLAAQAEAQAAKAG